MQQLTQIFNSRKELKMALKILLAKGYQYEEIRITRKEGIENQEEGLIQLEDSGNTALKKSIKGLKLGIISGAIITGGVVGLIMLFSESGRSLYPIATLATSLVIGAVWGGVLGFMLGSLFPLDSNNKDGEETQPRDFSINFLPHNEEDELYFKDKWQTAF